MGITWIIGKVYNEELPPVEVEEDEDGKPLSRRSSPRRRKQGGGEGIGEGKDLSDAMVIYVNAKRVK